MSRIIEYRSLDDIDIGEPVAVALGNFEGVHRGHRSIISKMVAYAKSKGLKSVVLTFSNHPRNFVTGKSDRLGIFSPKKKKELIEELGVDYLVNIPFDHEIMKMSPDTFIERLLKEKFELWAVFCGFNYNFGYKAKGSPETLRREGVENGFSVFEEDPFKIEGKIVSSTAIRSFISDGEMDSAEEFLGTRYEVSGIVEAGKHIGRKLGFPTCNLSIEDEMVIPARGVYVTETFFDDRVFKSVTNVGVKPTVGSERVNVETHIPGFSGNLYGKEIRVKFFKMLRSEQRFNGLEDLKNQIAKDINNAVVTSTSI